MSERKSKRSMGLDIGDARIGVALSDPLGMFAQPFQSVTRLPAGRRSDQRAADEIAQLIQTNLVETLVVGLPIELSGVCGTQASKVKKFQAVLNDSITAAGLSIRVEFVDERYSTREAEFITQGSKLKNKDRREAHDRVAAAVILQRFLERI